MSWLELPDDEATPVLARLTKVYREAGRPVPSVVAAMKPNAKAMRSILQMNMAVTFGGSVLGQEKEEFIATTVSALNDCFY